jgi:hypothetical protein
MSQERADNLIERAAELGTGLSPERDLWPGIAKHIARPPRRRWTPLLAQAAAVVLLIGGSSTMTLWLTRDEQPAPVQFVPQNLVFEQAAFGAEHTFGSVYRGASGDYRQQLDEQLERLSPEVRTEVADNLALIRAAIDEISVALEENPDSELLQELLLRSYRDQHAVMRHVGTLARQVMIRKDI